MDPHHLLRQVGSACQSVRKDGGWICKRRLTRSKPEPKPIEYPHDLVVRDVDTEQIPYVAEVACDGLGRGRGRRRRSVRGEFRLRPARGSATRRGRWRIRPSRVDAALERYDESLEIPSAREVERTFPGLK